MFGKNKKFLVQVPRQGGSYLIGTVDAKDIEDAKDTAIELLEQERNNPAIRRSQYYHLINTDNGQRLKIKNPFFDPELKEKKKSGVPSPKEIQELTYAELFTNLTDTISKTIPNFVSTLLTSNIDIFKEMTRKMIEKQTEGNQYDNLYKIGYFISQLVSLAKNKDAVLELVKSAKEEGIMKMFGGENVESNSESTEEHNKA